MKKRFLNLFLALAMVVLVLPMAADAASGCKHNRTSTSTVKLVEAKPATCTEDGYEAYYACTVCNKIYKPKNNSGWENATKVVVPAGHKYEGGVCTECKDCENDHLNKRRIITAGAATCAEDGAFEHVNQCKACGLYFCGDETNYTGIFPDNVRPATGEHNYTEKVSTISAATCTERQKNLYKCKDCDATEERYVGKEPQHTYDEGRITREATCKVYGLKKFECTLCDASYTERIDKLSHTEKAEEKVPATCVTPGHEAGKICSVCETVLEGMEEIPATGEHRLSTKLETVSPQTCTEKEVALYKCKYCDYTEEVAIGEPKGHKLWDKERIEPTCAEPGREAGKQCEYCKEFIEGGAEIEKLPHTPGKMKRYITYPTCQATGEAEYYCQKCEGTVNQVVPSLNCNIEDIPAVPATCKKDGTTAGVKCTVCEAATNGYNRCAHCASVKVDPQVDPKGHIWVTEDVFREPTCTVIGAQKVVCDREGCASYELREIPATGHNNLETLEAVDATCTSTGLTEGEKCNDCGEILTPQTVIEKLRHDWKPEPAKDPTCQEDGWNAHDKCAICGEPDGKTVIPASDDYHNYENNRCTICEELDPDHEHEGELTGTTAATCTAAGKKFYECSGCGYEWDEDIAMLAHSYSTTTDRCTGCGTMNPAHQHTYGTPVHTEATCTANGQVTKECTVCGYEDVTTLTAFGHSYSGGVCSRCGTAAACEHNHTTTTKTRNETCSSSGLKVTTCNSCGAQTATEVIPATGEHVYGANDRCTGCGQKDPNKSTLDNVGVYIVG